MSPFLYQVLLRLLPRERRVRDGEAMTLVFDELRHATRRDRGWLALAVLWMKETGGLVRFGWRERFGRRAAAGSSPSPNRGRWDFASELKWAWRAVRARGWRAGLAIGLLAIALSANVLMFAVTDSLLLHRVPYPQAERIVEIQTVDRKGERSGDNSLSAPLLDEWRKQTDLFSSVQAYLSKTTFLVGGGMAELVNTADVTPGLLELVGVTPRWGRSLGVSDVQDTGLDVVVIAEGLALKRFGAPDRAVGQRLETTTQPMLVVGVMPATFSFPQGGVEIWRVFDPRGPLARGFGGVFSIARMLPGTSLESVKAAMATRSPGIAEAAGRPSPYLAEPGAFYVAAQGPGAEHYLLLGAAICLLLISCANVANLELSGALPRARAYTIHAALGASRWRLARTALLEGALLIAFATAGAIALTVAGFPLLEASVPPYLWLRTANPIDLDARAGVMMTSIALLTWLVVSIPVVIHASRSRMLGLLKTTDRTHAASRAGAIVRRTLTAAEVALAVLLLIGGVLYTRTYQELLAINKGFESRNLAQIGFTIPVQYYTNAGMSALAEETIRRLTAVPGVVGATWASAPPATGNSPSRRNVEIDDRSPDANAVSLAVSPVDANYQSVVRLPLRQGRWLRADDPATVLVITETFAQRYWPGEDPIGHRVRLSPNQPWYDVIGVVGNLRTHPRRVARSSDHAFYLYALRQPPPPPPAPTPGKPPPRETGGSWRFLNITVRLGGPDRADAALAAARSVDPRVRVALEFVDDNYAEMHADTLLATRVVGGFAGLAFLVTIAGVYGVMAFLVAARTREIGIRMALGADRRDISRLVMRSSLLTVGIGAAIGIAAALTATQWTGSQFFGVTPTAPGTYVLVTAVVIATSLLATWRPARTAARIDPAITLKND